MHTDAACRSTAVYRWSPSTSPSAKETVAGSRRPRHQVDGLFEEIQRLATSGPGQTDHFHRGNETYLVVGENFADQIGIFIWRASSGSFSRVQTLHCAGAGATAITSINGAVWLIATSYHGGRTGWSTKSPVFVWEQGARGFVETALLGGHGVHDADVLEFKGRHYLVLAEDRDDFTSRVTSQVCVCVCVCARARTEQGGLHTHNNCRKRI